MQGNDESVRPPAAEPPGQAPSDQDRGRLGDSRTGKAEAERTTKGGDLQAYIGRQLRAVYDDVARQPIPDRFLELMKKLEAAGG